MIENHLRRLEAHARAVAASMESSRKIRQELQELDEVLQRVDREWQEVEERHGRFRAVEWQLRELALLKRIRAAAQERRAELVRVLEAPELVMHYPDPAQLELVGRDR